MNKLILDLKPKDICNGEKKVLEFSLNKVRTQMTKAKLKASKELEKSKGSKRRRNSFIERKRPLNFEDDSLPIEVDHANYFNYDDNDDPLPKKLKSCKNFCSHILLQGEEFKGISSNYTSEYSKLPYLQSKIFPEKNICKKTENKQSTARPRTRSLFSILELKIQKKKGEGSKPKH